MLREGYNRGYVVTRVAFSTGGGRWNDQPLKNDYSHIHDANQYGVLGLVKFDGWEDAEARSRKSVRKRAAPKFGDGFFAHQART